MKKELKTRAISWLKEEIRSLELAPELNGCPMNPEWAAQLEIMRTCLEAVKLSDFAEVSKQAEREYYAGFSSNTANIDREAWEPCEWCGDLGDSRYKLYAGFCMQKAADDIFEEETEKLNHCPKCGRPLTEEAWAELENRLRGTNP